MTEAVAAELRAERARRGMTLEDLSERSGVAYSTLGKVLNAQTSIDTDQLFAICEALGVSARGLIELAEREVADGRVLAFPSQKPSDGRPNLDYLKDLPSIAEPEREDIEGDMDPDLQ